MQQGDSRAGDFSISRAEEDGIERFSLSGELDIATAERLESALAANPPQASLTRVIDLAAVGFMDSTGLRILIAAHRSADAAGSQLVVVTGASPAKRVFELTGMDEHIRVVAALA